MTQQKEDTVIRTVLEIINTGGMENLREAISILINEAMKAERSSVINAQPWQATSTVACQQNFISYLLMP